jgi:hypothetical protein
MSGSWISLVALAATLLPLFWVKPRITWRIQELGFLWFHDSDVALVLYFVLVLPGIVVHELSHWLVAKLLRVRVSRLSLGPVRRGRGSRVSLGSVRVANVDPLRASLIGLAPLLGGTAVILFIGYWVLDIGDLGQAFAGRGVEGLLAGIRQLGRVPDFWLWLYFIFAVSNAMLPSESDMEAVRPVLIFLGITMLVVLIATGVPALPPDAGERAIALAGYLAWAFGLTLAVDAVFGLVTGVLLWLTKWLRGDRLRH